MGLESAQRTGNQAFLDSFSFARPKVLVIGCGGAGGNSVSRLHRMGIHGARTVVVNTDAVHLDSIQADRKLLIGGGVTRGMGAGGKPEIGERCAEISEQELRNQIGDADLFTVKVPAPISEGTVVSSSAAWASSSPTKTETSAPAEKSAPSARNSRARRPPHPRRRASPRAALRWRGSTEGCRSRSREPVAPSEGHERHLSGRSRWGSSSSSRTRTSRDASRCSPRCRS